jgi:ADP-ribose pyrophosphatase YjhB (NUDIX family)
VSARSRLPDGWASGPVDRDVSLPVDPHDPRSYERGADGRATDISSGEGVPRWVSATVQHCSRCGEALEYGPIDGEHRHRLVCPRCSFIMYVNPRMVVTAIPVTASGECVLIRRGIEPAYDTWAQPGGFLEIDETVNQAAIRETFEETGLLVEPGELIGLYSRLEAAIVVLCYEARIVGGAPTVTPEALEVRAFGPDEIPWDRIAFTTTYWAIRDWVAKRHPDVHLPAESPNSGRY